TIVGLWDDRHGEEDRSRALVEFPSGFPISITVSVMFWDTFQVKMTCTDYVDTDAPGSQTTGSKTHRPQLMRELLKTVKGNQVFLQLHKSTEGFKACPKSSCSKPVYPLPTMMPPINKVSWDTLWNCTAGQKIGVYLRLQKHAYPEKDQYIPQSSQESRLQSRSRKREMVTNRTSVRKSRMRESRKGLLWLE
ncbi:hypothetical protein EI555_003130, partial [Monodon monoceros]